MIEHFATLPILPMAKPRMTKADAWKKRQCVLDYWDFKNKINLIWQNQNLGEMPIPQKVIFHIPMPFSWSKKRQREMCGTPHLSKPDLDNLLKAFWDCLLPSDSHCWQCWAEKRWSNRGEIEIYKLADVGVIDGFVGECVANQNLASPENGHGVTENGGGV